MAQQLIDKALFYLGQRVLKTASATYTMTPKSAGAHGYFTVNFSGVPSTAKIVSTQVTTGSVSASGGMQIYVIASNYNSAYINYYLPQATTQNITFTVTIYYY